MQIEQSRARLAPRSAWQAMDLGVALWRQWWKPLLRIWLLTTLAPLVALLLLLPGQAWLAAVLFWWLKPLWDRPLLEFQARALFGEEPPAGRLLRELPRYAVNGMAGLLTWRRFSPWRSFHLPVFQLEDNRGSARARRLSVLHYPPSPRAGLLTILMLHLEQAFALAILILFYMLLPWQFNMTWAGFMVEQMDQWVGVLAWYLAMTLIEPLYVSCGFALYLNQRSRLEAWDLEPGLRRIARRRGAAPTAAAMVLVLPLLALTMPGESRADERADPRTEAAEILAQPDFMPMSEERTWRLKRDRTDERMPLFDRFLEWLLDREPGEPREPVRMPALLWPLVVVLMTALLAWLLWRSRHRLALPGGRAQPGRRTETAPAGRAPVALPPDIPAAVEQALAEDNRRAALSLLYRASLEQLARRGLVLTPGATEQELLRAAGTQAGFMRELTRSWMAAAWAHRPDDKARIRQLLADWRRHFEATEAGT